MVINDTTTEEVKSHGRAPVKALQSFEVLETKTGLFEGLLISLLRTIYQQRLPSIVELAPPEISDQILETPDTSGQNGQ